MPQPRIQATRSEEQDTRAEEEGAIDRHPDKGLMPGGSGGQGLGREAMGQSTEEEDRLPTSHHRSGMGFYGVMSSCCCAVLNNGAVSATTNFRFYSYLTCYPTTAPLRPTPRNDDDSHIADRTPINNNNFSPGGELD